MSVPKVIRPQARIRFRDPGKPVQSSCNRKAQQARLPCGALAGPGLRPQTAAAVIPHEKALCCVPCAANIRHLEIHDCCL